MTDELPHIGQCRDCSTKLRVSKTDLGGLIVKCSCSSRSIKVNRATPDTWQI